MGSTDSLNLAPFSLGKLHVCNHLLQSGRALWRHEDTQRYYGHRTGAMPQTESQSTLYLLSYSKSQGQVFHSGSEGFWFVFYTNINKTFSDRQVTHTDTNSPSLSSLGNNSLQKPKQFLFKLHFLFGTYQAPDETLKIGKF